MEDIDLLIVRYLDNAATLDEKKILENWINSSEDNRQYFVRMVKTWEKSHIYLQDDAIAEDHFFRFRQLLHRRKTRRLVYSLSAAAAVALLVLVIRFFVPASNVLLSEATVDQKKEIVLPDGSIVWLNKNSSIEYPNNFTSNREVFLTGEAFFDVTKNNGKPFTVKTKELTVQVLGTRFVVTDYNDEKNAEAVLETGKIKLKVEEKGEVFTLQPGQMVTHNCENGETQLQNVDVHQFTDWIKNSLVFENTSMKNVITQLEKWYGIKIECTDEIILQTPVTITIDKEAKEEVLNTLQIVVPFIWKEKPNQGERTSIITILPIE
ncbi:MAG: FecR family protein [Dysgonamonadaceae bacterium]|jgi:ferric-dicitrate binding protein FerR (iron transport regulator)|nr:FecR family protein [Dysgonamonadaceae bacterium]